ncbi:VOC family protein [Phototrophicus methaneseepsis]|uniref:VOC family protein n=1 Tax=Phototrophicus methaneseepsis TaxID=2710758 RepID=A0A7S8ECC9_9CHLR|nr:VOC family protein [Phototrophicus methaneseepsis]QPC84378.1 VOC family protein [Phototrophicus methaneseepsis]
MFKRLAHVNIGATDLAASEHFYCDILGMKKAFDFTRNGEKFGFYVEAGDTTFIEVFIQNEPPVEGNTLLKHLCLEVEDLDSVIETIRSRGWEVTDKKFGADKAWQAWITDPSGVRIELMQYTEGSFQFTGETCIVNW